MAWAVPPPSLSLWLEGGSTRLPVGRRHLVEAVRSVLAGTAHSRGGNCHSHARRHTCALSSILRLFGFFFFFFFPSNGQQMVRLGLFFPLYDKSNSLILPKCCDLNIESTNQASYARVLSMIFIHPRLGQQICMHDSLLVLIWIVADTILSICCTTLTPIAAWLLVKQII